MNWFLEILTTKLYTSLPPTIPLGKLDYYLCKAGGLNYTFQDFLVYLIVCVDPQEKSLQAKNKKQ